MPIEEQGGEQDDSSQEEPERAKGARARGNGLDFRLHERTPWAQGSRFWEEMKVGGRGRERQRPL